MTKTNAAVCAAMCGQVTSGPWAETILHQFLGGNNGLQPMSGLIFDSAGNLFGTTQCGIVFELSLASSGNWTEKKIYSFKCGLDAWEPEGNLVFDASGLKPLPLKAG